MRIDRKNDLDLRLIEVFAAMMERGTTPAAAEHLGLSQSAVWNAIRTLETQLDVVLFQRKGRRLEPTVEARLLQDDILPLAVVLDRLAGRLRGLKHQRRGRIAVAATPPIGHAVLPPALNRVLASRPALEVTTTVQPPRMVLREVELGLVDIGLMLGPVDSPGVQTRVLGEADLVAILPRDHLLTTRAVVGPSDLAKSALVSVGPALEPLVAGAFALQGVSYAPRLRCDQAQSACAFVGAGLGVAVVDAYSAANSVGRAIVTRRFAPTTRVPAVALLPPGITPDDLTEDLLAALAASVAALGPVGWG